GGFVGRRGGLPVQGQQRGGGDRGKGVGGNSSSGRQEAGGSVAEAAAGEAGELFRVADACGEGCLGLSLPRCVAEGTGRKLLGSSDARSSVAPGRPQGTRLDGVTLVKLVQGDDLRPPRMAALGLTGPPRRCWRLRSLVLSRPEALCRVTGGTSPHTRAGECSRSRNVSFRCCTTPPIPS